jgi:hypothetical protein
MAPFENWAWDHEVTHGSNLVTYIQGYIHPTWDAPATLENIVGQPKSLAVQRATDRLANLPLCVQRAAAAHHHLGGMLTAFPGTPVPTWFWGPTQQQFYLVGANSAWWPAEPDSPFGRGARP